MTILSVMGVVIGLTGCGFGDDYPILSGQDAIDAFAISESIHFTGNSASIHNSTDVIADGQNVGKIKESGFFNVKVTYSVDGEKQFYIELCDYDEEDKVVEDENYVCGRTYTYYDMEGNRLGYAQNRVLFEGDDESHVMVFLDTEGNMKNYYIEPYDDFFYDWVGGGAGIYNMDREKVGEIALDYANGITGKFFADIELGDAAGELSEMDRAVIYYRCIDEINHIGYS